MPLHNPVVLARQLATLDFLSGGRLRVGLGQGWSVDEIEAAGGTPKRRSWAEPWKVKVVEPLGPDTGLVGCAVTVKSAAWVPPMLTLGFPVRLRLAFPVL